MSIVNRALVWLGVEGADKAERDFQKVGEAGKKAGTDIETSFKKVGVALSQFGASVVDAVVDVKQLDAVTLTRTMEDYSRTLTRTAIATGQSLDGLKSRYMDLAKANGVMPQQIDAFAKSMGRMTYDIKGAQDAFTGLHNAATAFGEGDQEQMPYAVYLKNIKGVAGDTTQAVGKLFAQADKLGTVGGARALRDLFVNMGTDIDKSVSQLGHARDKAEAFIGILTKGNTGPQANRIAGATMGAFGGQWKDIARTVGYDVLDSEGRYKNLPKVAADLIGLMRRPAAQGGRGQDEQQILLAFRDWLGPEAGSKMYHQLSNGAFRGVNSIAGLGPSGGPAAAAAAYRTSGIGQIDLSRIGIFEKEMQLAQPLFDLKSGISGWVGQHPVAAMAGAMGVKALLNAALPKLAPKLLSAALGVTSKVAGIPLIDQMIAPSSVGQGELSGTPLEVLLKERAAAGKTGMEPEEFLYGKRSTEVRTAEQILQQRGANPQYLNLDQIRAALGDAVKEALKETTVKVQIQDTPSGNVETDKQPDSKN